MLRDKLIVGEPVARDDGRFYVPLHIDRARPGLSNILLRVASDAFETLEKGKPSPTIFLRLGTIKILVDQYPKRRIL